MNTTLILSRTTGSEFIISEIATIKRIICFAITYPLEALAAKINVLGTKSMSGFCLTLL